MSRMETPADLGASRRKSLRSSSKQTVSQDESLPLDHAMPQPQCSAQATGRQTRSMNKKRKRAESPPPDQRHTAPEKVRGTQRVGSPKKRKLDHAVPSKAKKVTEAESTNARQAKPVIPPWQTLPYHVLLEVFTHASRLRMARPSGPSSPLTGPRWLIGIACLCRTFAEPALTVLYNSPPLMPPSRAHRFLRHLQKPAKNMLFDYKNKVRRLELDAAVLTFALPGRGRLNLSRLVRLTPRLRNLEIDTSSWICASGGRYPTQQPWSYPEELFEALEFSGVQLQNWCWSSMLARLHSCDSMKRIHQLMCFQRLEHLSFTYYMCEGSTHPSIPAVDEADVASALAVLPKLKHLTFLACLFVKQGLLTNLPEQLTTLSLHCCYNVTSDMLQLYLTTRGRQLKKLELHSNVHLGLSFLSSLASSCPRLELLDVINTMDQDALTALDLPLQHLEAPTWPSTLRTLELNYLQRWSVRNAETLFKSLLDAAPRLRDLRQLVLKIKVPTYWRDRAKFRDHWVRVLKRKFLRVSDSSLPSTAMNGSMNGGKATAGSSSQKVSSRDTETMSAQLHTRKSQRLRLKQQVPAPNGGQRAENDRTEDDGAGEGEGEVMPAKDESAGSMQGMCDEVIVLIDNMRPAENQLTEADFLDDEASGDEDWNGHDPEIAAEGYAW